jgi:hypothetical protein
MGGLFNRGRVTRIGLTAALLLLAQGCADESSEVGSSPDPQPPGRGPGSNASDSPPDQPDHDAPGSCGSPVRPAVPIPVSLSGPTSFLSVDESFFVEPYDGEEEEEEEEEEEADDRVLEEGDIYRVLGDGVLLNLNRFHGLQVVDIHDPTSPTILGEVRVAGTPVEMYVVDDRAIVLMNGWYGYRASSDGTDVEARSGGTVLLVDLSNRAAPAILSEVDVPGQITTSRLAHGSKDSLYLASANWQWLANESGDSEWSVDTVVKSFDVTPEALAPRSEIDLGGSVTAVHAESNVLLAARFSEGWDKEATEISVIDISDPDGAMVLGDTVTVAGYVRSQFHMDLRGDELRVFSGPWSGTGTTPNYLQTWNASDLNSLVPIDKKEFGADQSLFGSVFLDDKAFAVTYYVPQKTDPFHAFSIDPDGYIAEESAFIVSGWNNFFRPVLDATRLIGIGVNDESAKNELAVSLYDITNLTNPDPLVARVEVDDDAGGWVLSEALWDHRAFTVLQDAVSTKAPTGETETGLVMLPFSGWKHEGNDSTYRAAVQLFTFSSTTLTRRGVMPHGSPVRRTFLAGNHTAANVSEVRLSLHDQSDLDHPAELGSLPLAQNYTRVLTYGDHRVRVRAPDGSDWDEDQSVATVEIVPGKARIDLAKPVASFEVPSDAQVFKVGDLLVAMTTHTMGQWPDSYTTLRVFDLSDASTPKEVGQLKTTGLPWLYPDSYSNPGPLGAVHAAGKALAFVRDLQEEGDMYLNHACLTYPGDGTSCDGKEGCSYTAGQRLCNTIDSGPEYCNGGLAACAAHDDADPTCEPVDASEAGVLYTYCSDEWQTPYTHRLQIHTVDLTDPRHPSLTPPVTFPLEDDAVRALASGGDLYVTVKRKVASQAAPSPDASYFLRRVDLSDPSHPALGPAISVPGEVVAVNGTEIFTHDKVWGDQLIESAVARLELHDGLAYLQSYQRFPERRLHGIVVGDRGLPLLTSSSVWLPYTSRQKLTVLAPAGGGGFDVRSDAPIQWQGTPYATAANRAFFQVAGGVLMLDVENPGQPLGQAYFQTLYQRSEVVIGDNDVLLAAGRYGIHQLDLCTSNLRPASE